MGPARQRAAWTALTAAGALIVFAPAVVGQRTLSQRDTDRLYAPVRTLVVEELRDGRLPLWNPYEATGKPLFAEGIHSVLHPVSLVAAALAPSSIDFLILAYLVAAALGAFAFARVLGASLPASAGSGLAFALSGYSASMTGNLVFLAGLSTLPWLLAAARVAGAGSRWGEVGLALAAACAFLSGDTQVALVGLGLGTLLAADAGGRRGMTRALVGMGAGLLLAGVQIAATSELLPLTYRSLDLEDWEKTQWALAPGRLLEWVVPGLFRGALAEVPTGSGLALDKLVFAESVYLGAPLLVAATLGFRSRGRTGVLLGVAVIVLAWLAAGHHLGSRQILDWVPVWNRFRYSEKLMAPLTLCACALGALGIDSFGATRLSRTWKRVLGATAIAAAAALLTILLAPDATRNLSTLLLGEPGPFYRSTLAAGLPHLVVALGALLAVDRLGPGSARTSALAFLLALAPAVAVYSGAHLGSREARRFTTPMRLEDESPVPRIFHPLDRMASPGDPEGPVDSSARIESRLLGEAIGVASRVDTFESYGAFEPRRFETLARSCVAQWPRAARRFATSHVVVQAIPHASAFAMLAAPAIEDGRLVQRDDLLGFEVWTVPHRPWAFFARRGVAAERALDARKALLDLVARGDDDTVVVEAPESPPSAPGRVLRVDRGTESVSIEAESLGPALLVVQDAWWPGWRATIDGRPAEILPADYLVRAVPWPPGRHRLEMTYDPPEIRVGLALSALGAVIVLVLAALAARLRPSARASP